MKKNTLHLLALFLITFPYFTQCSKPKVSLTTVTDIQLQTAASSVIKQSLYGPEFCDRLSQLRNEIDNYLKIKNLKILEDKHTLTPEQKKLKKTQLYKKLMITLGSSSVGSGISSSHNNARHWHSSK